MFGPRTLSSSAKAPNNSESLTFQHESIVRFSNACDACTLKKWKVTWKSCMFEYKPDSFATLIVVPIHLRMRLHFFFFSACLFGMTFAAKEGKSNPQSVDESPMTKPNMGLLNFLWFILSFFFTELSHFELPEQEDSVYERAGWLENGCLSCALPCHHLPKLFLAVWPEFSTQKCPHFKAFRSFCWVVETLGEQFFSLSFMATGTGSSTGFVTWQESAENILTPFVQSKNQHAPLTNTRCGMSPKIEKPDQQEKFLEIPQVSWWSTKTGGYPYPVTIISFDGR